ncbi:MAG: hypothetical protein E6Q67_15250 [Roseateles sp.]|nr:MAG: hypothetical protein E6Q67_15250 [Roseateles sp.]
MGLIRWTALALIVAGALSLVYGGVSYTREHTAAKLGPVEIKVEETQDINIPVWMGVGAVVVGGLVLLGTGRR